MIVNVYMHSFLPEYNHVIERVNQEQDFMRAKQPLSMLLIPEVFDGSVHAFLEPHNRFPAQLFNGQ